MSGKLPSNSGTTTWVEITVIMDHSSEHEISRIGDRHERDKTNRQISNIKSVYSRSHLSIRKAHNIVNSRAQAV